MDNELELLAIVADMRENPSEERMLKLIRKFGSAYRLTDRGVKYYKDLITKYMSGLKINDEKLLILLGLNVYGSELDDYAISTDNEIINEIKQKLGFNPNNDSVINELLTFMFRSGYIEDNPHFIERFNKMANDRMNELVETKQW